MRVSTLDASLAQVEASKVWQPKWPGVSEASMLRDAGCRLATGQNKAQVATTKPSNQLDRCTHILKLDSCLTAGYFVFRALALSDVHIYS